MGTSAAALETAEKKGFDTGMRARHPFDPDWTLPVYVANFVLMDYGTGAIFGCPAHDQRDLDFANAIRPAVTRRSCARPSQDPARLRRRATSPIDGRRPAWSIRGSSTA